MIAAVGLVWACFGFRYTAFAPSLPLAVDFFSSFHEMLPASGVGRWLLVHAQELRLLPEAFLQGFAYVLYAARERPAFLAGEYATTGWWWFFPFAFLVKSSVAELLAFTAVPVAFALKWFRNRAAALRRAKPLVPLVVFAAVYVGVSLASNLNIGQRHILPLYPILFILAGVLAVPSRIHADERIFTRPQSDRKVEPDVPIGLESVRSQSSPTRTSGSTSTASLRPKQHQTRLPSACLAVSVLLPLLIATLAIFESATIRPHYLAFFNRLAGGPENGRHLLGDSSLDWGQNLPRLASWLDNNRQPNEPVYLSYFGADDPFYRGIQPIELSPYYSFGRELRWQPLTGGIYSISASMLQDASSPYSGPWTTERERTYQQLRNRINQEIDARTRSPVFIGSGEPDVEIWNLDRLRFARLCMYLRLRDPDAVIGHSIFVFRLTDQEIKKCSGWQPR